MTNEERRLLRAVCDTNFIEWPECDAPRLAHADWCERNGRPERAAFIRLGVEYPDQYIQVPGEDVDLPGFGPVMSSLGYANSVRLASTHVPRLVPFLETTPLEEIELTDVTLTLWMRRKYKGEGAGWLTSIYIAENRVHGGAVDGTWPSREAMVAGLAEWTMDALACFAKWFPQAYFEAMTKPRPERDHPNAIELEVEA